MRDEDRRGERDADRAADLLVRVDQPRREPGIVRLDLGQRGDRHGDEREREPEREDQVRRQQVRPEVPVHRDLRVPEHRAASTSRPATITGRGPKRVVSACATPAQIDGRPGGRQERHAGLERRPAEHLLHVEGQDEEVREDHRAEQEPDHVGAEQRADAEDPEGHQRRPRCAARSGRSREERARGDQQQDRAGRGPADVGRLRDRVDEQREAAGDRDRAGRVEAAVAEVGAALAGRTAARGRSTSAPTGTLTKKIHSQPRYLVMIPPKRTPAAAPRAAERAPDSRAPCSARRPPRKVVVTIDSAAGEMIAAPMPCTARAPISTPMLLASPQTSEAMVKSVRPTRKIRLRPSRSAMRPPRSRKPPNVIA